MSTTIDNKVVQMQFDNKQFERNVATSMSTLDKLKKSLNLTGAAKGLEDVGSAAKKIDLSGLSSAAEGVSVKFSYMQATIQHQLNRIVDSAVSAGKRVVSALTIDPIKTGLAEYETQINAVQTIMANTSSKGTTLDQVNAALDELNTYADKTIYNFTEMTRNIGTFTAAGVDLDTSVKSIQGIANLAAVSGSTSQQASTAMYQLSQALAAGKVQLMDWNSVVNAGMGGQVFQDALKRTATAMGTNVDAMIKKYGSFRESLTQGNWLTAEVLTKTLEQFTMAAKEGSKEWEAYKKSLMDDGYTAAQAEEILKMANTATDAATKVKTFTQLWDTLKETAQSGWTQTWETILGDFEEAKSLFSELYQTLSPLIESASEARNELLEGALGGKSTTPYRALTEDLLKLSNEQLKTKGYTDEQIKALERLKKATGDTGMSFDELRDKLYPPTGRDLLIDSVRNAFEAVGAVVKPIKEAFREIFPPMTVKQLYGMIEGFHAFTEKLIMGEKTAAKFKSVCKGVFSVLDIGIEAVKAVVKGIASLIKNFAGVEDKVLGTAASFGDWVSNLRDSIKQGDIFGKVVGTITGFLGNVITKLKEFGSAVKDAFTVEDADGLLGIFKGIWNFIKELGSKAAEMFSPIMDGIYEIFGGSSLTDLINSGLFAGILATIFQFSRNLKKPFDSLSDIFETLSGEEGIFENIKGVLDDVRGCFQAYQDQLKAGTLLKIAGAIAILAAAIFVMSTIDENDLTNAVGGITALFIELISALAVLSKIDMKGASGVTKSIGLMIGMSVAIAILAVAMKTISGIDSDAIAKGLISIGVLMAELSIFLRTAKFDGKVKSSATGIVILSAAMLILAKAVENFGDMSWGEIGKGLAAIGGLLAELAIFTRLTGSAKHVVKTGASMVLLGAAMKIFASAVKDFASMQWDEIGRGLAAMSGALVAVTLALNFMPKNMLSIGMGLVIVGTALKILASALGDFSGMTWGEIGKGLVVMGGALAEIAIALIFMKGSLAGSAALIIAAGALAIMVPVLKSLGEMSWGEIARGLVALAGAFAVIGIAGLVLSPIVPVILGLAAAFALFGVASLGIGAGLVLIAAGISALGGSIGVAAVAIVAGVSAMIVGIVELIPTIIEALGKAIVAFCQVIIDCAPKIAETILVVITEVMASLATYAPQITDSLLSFLIGIIDALANRMPELIAVAMKFIAALIQGIADAFGGLGVEGLINGILVVGLMSGLVVLLSAITGFIPGAMLAVLGLGALVAELALVLAAIGALTQIPGLEQAISDGGNLLQTVGTAIGQFVGGIVGGFGEGLSSSLPTIGENLSTFMTNIQPFIEGAKLIDSTMFEGVKALTGAILALTAANVVDSIASFITGGSSMSDFADQLVPFGAAMKEYSIEVAGIDTAAISTSATAAKNLVAVAKAIPSDGIFGTDGIDDFGKNIVSFGKSLKKYGEKVAGIDTSAMLASVTAAKTLIQVANLIPDDGTFGSDGIDDFGKNLVSFAKSLTKYGEKAAEIDTASIGTSITSARRIVSFIEELSGMDTSGVDVFKSAINSLAKTNLSGFMTAFNRSATGLSKVGVNIVKSISDGIKNSSNSLTNVATNLIKKVASMLNSKKSLFETSGKALFNGLITGVNNRTSALYSKFSTVMTTAVRRIRNYYNDFYYAGAHVVSGFVSGISSQISSAASAAASMAASAVAAARAHLRINSPSKEFYEIGDYSGQGFVNALVDFAQVAYKAGGEMASSAKRGLSNSIGKIQDMLDGNMDTRPTIRPVLDLSDVRAGAKTLGNLLDIDSSVGVLANVGTISASMRGYGQNGDNSEVVSAINKLNKNLGKVGNTYNSINGITYDDGSNISDAIKTLVRATRIERRT